MAPEPPLFAGTMAQMLPLYCFLAIWGGALVTCLCTARRATPSQKLLRGAALVLALTTLAQGAALLPMVALMVLVCLGTLASRSTLACAPADSGERSRAWTAQERRRGEQR